MQDRPGACGERRQVRLVRPGQALGPGRATRQPVPAHGVGDRHLKVGACVTSLDERRAQPGQQAHLVVHGAGVAQERVLLADLGAAEHAPDGAVEDAHAIVGQARDGVEHRGDERGATPERRQGAQVLRCEAPALAREPSQARP